MIIEKNFSTRIVLDPKIMGGKPIIKGTRLTVQHILELLAQGFSKEQIIVEHPQLTEQDITACFIFAAATLENTTFSPHIG
jgi:uncharacterized protein (DUF433 family)